MLNKVQLIGRLGKDPEIKQLDGGQQVASFSMATTEVYKDKTTNEKKEITEWHNIVVWGSLAGVVEKYIRKGSLLFIEGKISTRKWQDKEGKDRWSTSIIARELKMLGGKPSGSTEQQEHEPEIENYGNTGAPVNADFGAGAMMQEDDLPF